MFFLLTLFSSLGHNFLCLSFLLIHGVKNKEIDDCSVVVSYFAVADVRGITGDAAVAGLGQW